MANQQSLVWAERLEAWLESHIGFEFFKSGFERTQDLLGPFVSRFKQRKLKIITIGGTNGKGQTSFELEHLLISQGKKTALWTSPHILSVAERFRFNGQKMEEGELLNLFEICWQNLKSQTQVSYYEFLFYCFCQQVERTQELDTLILEVGLGGRLDAVNVFDADLCALTSISLDHTQILGDTPKAILKEKWGITRAGNPVVTCFADTQLRSFAGQLAREGERPWFDCFEENLLGPEHSFPLRNQMTAATLAAWESSFPHPPPTNEVRSFYETLRMGHRVSPGRFERMTLGALRFIFIGAHNIDGLSHLVNYYESESSKDHKVDQVLLSLSARPLHEAVEAIEILLAGKAKIAPHWRFCLYHHPKALTKAQIEEEVTLASLLHKLARLGIEELENVFEDIKQSSSSSTTFLVTGSYYFIAEVQKLILKHGGRS